MQTDYFIKLITTANNSKIEDTELYKFLLKNNFNIKKIYYHNIKLDSKFKSVLIEWPINIIPINYQYFIESITTLSQTLRNLNFRTPLGYIKFITIYSQSRDSLAIELDAKKFFDYYDLNSKKDFIKFHQKILSSRSFNTLNIIDNWILKKSSHKKLHDEFEFLKIKQLENNELYPKVTDFKYKTGIYSYKVEHIKMLDSAYLLTNDLLKGDIFEKFKKHINTYFDEIIVNATKPNSKEIDLFLTNFNNRIKQLWKNNEIRLYIKFLSSLLEIDIEKEIILFCKNYNEEIKNFNIGNYNFIHGDLCLSNILFDYSKDKVKLIDPRGIVKLKYPVAYDIAKLSHSLLGNYDFIVNNLNNLNLNKLKNTENLNDPLYEQYIKDLAKKNKLNYKVIRKIEASLFLSMIPLHLDSKLKFFNFLCNFYKINQELKNWKN